MRFRSTQRYCASVLPAALAGRQTRRGQLCWSRKTTTTAAKHTVPRDNDSRVVVLSASEAGLGSIAGLNWLCVRACDAVRCDAMRCGGCVRRRTSARPSREQAEASMHLTHTQHTAHTPHTHSLTHSTPASTRGGQSAHTCGTHDAHSAETKTLNYYSFQGLCLTQRSSLPRRAALDSTHPHHPL